MNCTLGRLATFVTLILTFAVSTSASAQSLADSPIIFHNGQWDVHRTTNAMTDAAVCTGVYKNQYGVQLSENALTIAINDGDKTDAIKTVRLRFDEEDAKPSRPASKDELKNNAIEISGGDFNELLDSKRLRYEVLMESNTALAGDINLDGAFLVHGNVAAGCAGNPIPGSSRAVTGDACSQVVRDRMSQKGITAQDINDICGKSP
jgi:hypothetical protein